MITLPLGLIIGLLVPTMTTPTPLENPDQIARFLDGLGGPERVRVTHFGDSHIAADLWTAPIRAGLQDRYGDGGRGFVLAGKPWASYWQSGIANSTTGDWSVAGIKGGVDDGWFGPGGCAMASADGEASVTVGRAEGHAAFAAADIHFMAQPEGGCMEVRVDGKSVGRHSTRGPWAAPGFVRIEVEPDAQAVSIHPVLGTGEVRVFGVSLDNTRGLAWDALGLNGARATRLLKTDPIGFAGALQRMDPTLIVLSFGANELFDEQLDAGVYATDQERVMQRLKQAAPGADCLITGPPDMLRARQTPALMGEVYQIQRDLAARHGCAFWDTQGAMGGVGAIRGWRRKRLAGGDFVHLTRAGYVQIGEALLAAILEAKVARR
ncbi:MAG: lysophospholipase L1-like esterase [Bradymonadia bacterium]|jgi:lysophospholipase L1-like esterase